MTETKHKDESLSFSPPWEPQIPFSSSRALHPFLLEGPGLLINLPKISSLDPMDCSPLVSSLHGILQARILEWVALSSPGDLPNSGIKPRSPALQADSYHLSYQGSPFTSVGVLKRQGLFSLKHNPTIGTTQVRWIVIPRFDQILKSLFFSDSSVIFFPPVLFESVSGRDLRCDWLVCSSLGQPASAPAVMLSPSLFVFLLFCWLLLLRKHSYFLISHRTCPTCHSYVPLPFKFPVSWLNME